MLTPSFDEVNKFAAASLPASGKNHPVCSHQARPAGEEFLHHGLLEGAGLLPPLRKRRQLRIHLHQHLGDGDLFGKERTDKSSFFKEFEMPIVTGCRYAAKLKLECMEMGALPVLCRENLRSVRTHDEIKIHELNNACMVAKNDHSSFRAMKAFVGSI